MTVHHTLLIDNLRNPALYPHPCTHVELVETHISWVLLTGLRAYKLKKPVDLGFADFSTLERRRHCCEEELRLNRRTAPNLYLDVVAITGTVAEPQISGAGPVLDYAVCMLQFDQQKLLSLLPPGDLQPAQIDALADQCADLHARAGVAARDSVFGRPEHVMHAVRENFRCLQDVDESLRPLCQSLARQAERRFAELRPIFEHRKQTGMIRECHGDLHLGNMFLQDGQVTIFDGIEFNEDLRWIDIVSDIAFTVMDLEDRGDHHAARRLLNRWLERTGDYSGLQVLPFYCAYRAVVRAKVDAIQIYQPGHTFSDQRHLANDCRGYLELAQQYTVRHQPALLITMGPSGSGKTTVTQRLIEGTDAIRVRSDVERKRLHGLAPEEHSSPELKQTMYAAEATAQTYEHLADLATQVIAAGFPVVVDATFLRRAERRRFAELADTLGVPFLIIRCAVAPDLLRTHIRQRQQQGQDASEADERVLQSQLRSMEPPDLREQPSVIAADAGDLTAAVRLRLSND